MGTQFFINLCCWIFMNKFMYIATLALVNGNTYFVTWQPSNLRLGAQTFINETSETPQICENGFL
jgi:hypothetical protein